MGKVVEDDVVRMQFENGQFEKKIRQSQKSIEALKKSTTLVSLERVLLNFKMIPKSSTWTEWAER